MLRIAGNARFSYKLMAIGCSVSPVQACGTRLPLFKSIQDTRLRFECFAVGKGKVAETVTNTATLALRKGEWGDQPLPTTPKGLGKERCILLFGHRGWWESPRKLVLQVSALSRNDAAARGWLLPRVRTAGGAIAVTSLPSQEVGSAPGVLDTNPS